MARLPQSLPASRAIGALNLARVLLVHGDLAPRLALQTILQAGGYRVDMAATPAEALAKLDEHQYELVLSDGKFGSSEEGRNVLAYARVKSYQPATALITSTDAELLRRHPRGQQHLSVYTENLPAFLTKVAELIGLRAIRRYRPLRQAV
jgi:CheY-like chemotaxis protein